MAPEELSGRVETARHGSRAEVTVPVYSGQLPRHLTTVPTVVGAHPHLPLQARGAPDGAHFGGEAVFNHLGDALQPSSTSSTFICSSLHDILEVQMHVSSSTSSTSRSLSVPSTEAMPR